MRSGDGGGWMKRLLVAVAVALTTALTACGSGEKAPPIKLSQPEYRVLRQYERDVARLQAASDAETPRGIRRMMRAEHRYCRRAARSGPVLRALGPTCRATNALIEVMIEMPAQVRLCRGDADCTIGTGLGLEVPLLALWGADKEARRALRGLQASEGCRDHLLGSDEWPAQVRATALATRTLSTRFRASRGGGGPATTPAELKAAAEAYDRETDELLATMRSMSRTKVASCRGDVA